MWSSTKNPRTHYKLYEGRNGSVVLELLIFSFIFQAKKSNIYLIKCKNLQLVSVIK